MLGTIQGGRGWPNWGYSKYNLGAGELKLQYILYGAGGLSYTTVHGAGELELQYRGNILEGCEVLIQQPWIQDG